jgi:hypothetical protein
MIHEEERSVRWAAGPGYERIKRSARTRELLSTEEKEQLVMGLGPKDVVHVEAKYIGRMKTLF